MYKAIINEESLKLEYSGYEALNTICTNISFSGKNVKRIVLTSCEPNDGKSFAAIQITANMAKRGKRVLLIDADLRLSVMNAHYGIQLTGPGFGLAHYLSGQAPLEDVMYETNMPNIYLIPIGTDVQAPLSLIDTPDFDKLIQTVGETFDYVIIDAPPVGLVIDAAQIAKSCDGSILMLEYNKTHRRSLQDAKEQMERSGTPILGCILNKVSLNSLSAKKYYSYGGKYGYGKYGKYGKYGRYGYSAGYYRRDDKEAKKGKK